MKHSYKAHLTNEEIWDLAYEKANRLSVENGTSIVEELMEGTKAGKDAIKKYKRRELNWREDTRALFLHFIKEMLQEQAADADARQEITRDEQPVKQVTKLRHNPPVPPGFCIGRDEQLKEIHQALLQAANRQNIVLLSGVGGMGKTTLMQEYLSRDEYNLVFDRIIVVTVEKGIEDSFIEMAAKALQIDIRDIRQQDKLFTVVEHMRQCGGTNLFVIDNVNEYNLKELLRMKTHFNQTGWKFLITTRTVPDGFKTIFVKELDEDMLSLLFIHHYIQSDQPITDEQELKKIIRDNDLAAGISDLVNHALLHTLLIELLAKMGRKKQMTPEKLLAHLKDQDTRLPFGRIVPEEQGPEIDTGDHGKNRRATVQDYLFSLFDTDYLFEESGDQKQDEENKYRLKLLRFFSILPSEDIDIPDLGGLYVIADNEKQFFENILDDLKQSGWLQSKARPARTASYLSDAYYKMHQLVQEIVYDRLHPDTYNCEELIDRLTKLLSKEREKVVTYKRRAQFMIDKLMVLDELRNQRGITG